MIARERSLRTYCTNFKEIENYEEGVQSSEPYDLHHRKEIETLDDSTVVLRSKKELIEMNLYYHRPPEELIFLKRSEHLRMHNEGSKSPMYGRSREKSPRWKGGVSFDHNQYMRDRNQRKRLLALQDVVEEVS